MAKFSFGKLISAAAKAAKAADRAIKNAAKENEKARKAADSLRIKAEKERVKKEKSALKASTIKANPYPAVNTSVSYGRIAKPKTKEDADALNRSFHTADHKRVQSLGFVLGIEIKRSNTLDDVCEICRIGAGKYPKDFKWTGWHNGCKCHTTSITMGMEEFGRYQNAILNGTESRFLKSVKGVDCVPSGLLSYVAANREFCLKQDWYMNNKKYFSSNTHSGYYY